VPIAKNNKRCRACYIQVAKVQGAQRRQQKPRARQCIDCGRRTPSGGARRCETCHNRAEFGRWPGTEEQQALRRQEGGWARRFVCDRPGCGRKLPTKTLCYRCATGREPTITPPWERREVETTASKAS
jgi:hypothetical protein